MRKDGTVRNRTVLDRVIVSPQRFGDQSPSVETLSQKTAAFVVPIIRVRPFEHCDE